MTLYKNYLHNIITLSLFVTLYAFKLEAVTIRDYDYKTDYQAAHAICAQHWKVLEESDSLCSGTFDIFLLSFSPYGLKTSKPKAKVLVDTDVIGILLYGNLAIAPQILQERGVVADGSYAELSYIALDEKYQGKGYGSFLFNACKEELLRTGTIKTVLARVSNSNMQAINWHQKEGFILLTESTSSNHFEEGYRIQAQASGQLVFKLELHPRAPTQWSSWKKYLQQRTISLLKEQKGQIVNSIAQTKLAHMVADATADSQALLSHDERAHIARHYFIRLPEKQAPFQTVTYMLGKKKLTPQLRQAIQKIFTYIDKYSEVFSYWINTPEQIESFYKEADKIIAMDTFMQTQALLQEAQRGQKHPNLHVNKEIL